MHKGVFLYVLGVGLLALVMGWALFNSEGGLTGLAIFTINDQISFDQGTYQNTSFNGTHLALVGENLTGSYTSHVLNATSIAHWNNISWSSEGITPLVFVRSCSQSDCSDRYWSQLILRSPGILSLDNATYFQYRFEFARTSITNFTTISSVSVDYDLTEIPIAISISEPSRGSQYGSYGPYPLTYVLNGTSLDSCWYNINDGPAINLPGCQNSTFDISENGNYTLRLFANTTQGITVNRSTTFNVTLGAPTVYLVDPSFGYLTNNTQQDFTYYANDSDMDRCSLLTDFGGIWGTSSTDTQIITGDLNTFSSSAVSNGNFLWGIECLDIASNEAKTGSRVITVDTLKPSLTLNGPTGTINSKEGISLTPQVTDLSATTCVYTITRVGQGALLVIVVPQCSGTTFNVDKDGEYSVTVTATDAAGNSASSSSNFLVSSSSSSSSGGNGGSGSGSVGVGNIVTPRISHSVAPSFSLKPGFSENGSIEFINSGNTYLNGCSIESSDLPWITGRESFSLTMGEHYVASFTLAVPRNTVPATYSVDLRVNCNELDELIVIPTIVLPADFEFTFGSAERQGTALIVNYTLKDLTGSSQEIDLLYSLKNSEGIITLEGASSVQLGSNELKNTLLTFELPKDTFGEIDLHLELNSPNDELIHIESIFIPFNTVSGFAVSNDNQKTLTIWGIVVFISMGLIFTLRFAYKRWTKASNLIASNQPLNS